MMIATRKTKPTACSQLELLEVWTGRRVSIPVRRMVHALSLPMYDLVPLEVVNRPSFFSFLSLLVSGSASLLRPMVARDLLHQCDRRTLSSIAAGMKIKHPPHIYPHLLAPHGEPVLSRSRATHYVRRDVRA